MANLASNLITNQLAVPPVFTDVHFAHGRTRKKIAKWTGDAAQNDVILLARFYAADVILSAKLYNTALGVSVTGDLGAYVKVEDLAAALALVSGTAEDRFAAAVDLNTARPVAGTAAPLEIWNEQATVTIDNMLAPLWQACGLAAEPTPGTQFDLGLKLEAANPAAGTIGVVFEYLSGD